MAAVWQRSIKKANSLKADWSNFQQSSFGLIAPEALWK